MARNSKEQELSDFYDWVKDEHRTARAGQGVELRAELKNRGNGNDYFKLIASSLLGWRVEFPEGDIVGPLSPQARDIIPIKVIVPSDAKVGQRDTVTITATSQFNLSVSDSSFATVTVRR